MTFLRCQPLTAALVPAVVALDRRCLGGLWSAAGYQREIDSSSSDLLVLLAADGPSTIGQPIGVGCIWAILEEAHITLLAIDSDYQRQRLGQLLLTQLLVAARCRQLTHATLEVRVSNQAAIQLYQKFGFQTAGQRKQYYADGEDALILWCSSLQSADWALRLQQSHLECRHYLLHQGWQRLDLRLCQD
ncbi:MAG: ribosomal protein S18-alanine N-acetyltransferase [Leptolyngbya sp. SIO4C1]|nr:ribosomal protein S18-alanine N-acetyltransferase [Leptolyngbya sp. SIO4C1]